MPTIPDVVGKIQAHVAPVVFLDTCVLLDVIRAPRRNISTAVQAAIELSTAAQRMPPRVHLVIGFPTPTEWNDHVDETVEDCRTAVNVVNAVSEAWTFLGHAGVRLLSPLETTLPERLRTLSETLRDASILLDKDDVALSRAFDRVIGSRRPAKKGGKGAKDAAILEHAVRLMSELRIAGFAGRCVFVSSNTNDFATANTTVLHPDLRPDFDSINLEYAASLNAAVALLRAGGWVP
jgi:hypothetical protein